MTNEEFEECLKQLEDIVNKGGIFFMTCDGIMTQELNTFLKQSVEGILYDLNRDKATTIALARSADSFLGKRWVNDLAVAYVIKALKCELDKYKEKYGK